MPAITTGFASTYYSRRRFGDIFIPECIDIINTIFDTKSYLPTTLQDKQENTDLLFNLNNQIKTVSIRIRKYDKLEKFGDEICFRTSTSGFKQKHSEYEKILSNLGDFYLYAFANKQNTKLKKWKIIDLDAVRFAHKTDFCLAQSNPKEIYYYGAQSFISYYLPHFEMYDLIYADSTQPLTSSSRRKHQKNPHHKKR